MMSSATAPAESKIGGTKVEVGLAADDVVDLKGTAVLGEPIVGIEVVTHDERGQGALAARPLPTPKQPTPAQIAQHNLTHLPYADWCWICVSCRRPNDHHRARLAQDRLQPLLVADYAFVRNKGDDTLVPLLVARLYPFGVYFVVVVPCKGIHKTVVERLARFLNEAGLVKFSVRSDKEPSISPCLKKHVS